MIRAIISRDTCKKHHVANGNHGSACSCTTINYCTTWLVVFKHNNTLLHLVDNCQCNRWDLYINLNTIMND